MPQIRLDKFFSSQNLATRKEVKELLKQGAILVNGQTGNKAEDKIDPEKDEICLNGTPVNYKKYLYLMMNKPQGVVSATNDRSQTTVLDLVPPELFRPGLFPAGRLDKDTTGFLLLTDDGEFAHRILSPKKHIAKTYHALLSAPLSEEQMKSFENGLVLKDGFQCLPARITPIGEGRTPLVEIVLWEGKYHQIKRMIGALGEKVLALKRVKMGGLPLDPDLQPGQCREILHKDVEKILE